MACVYKYNNQSFETIDQLVSYISDNKLEEKISDLVKALETSSSVDISDVVTVYHHTNVKPQDFNFGSFQRGKNQVSQFGDGLNASSTTTPFLIQRYGQPIKGEIKDSDFIVIDSNKSEKELYEELKAKGYKFNNPLTGSYIQNDPAKEYDGTEKANEQPAIINLFNDFQKSNPEVKGVKVINHIIGGQKADPFYVIYNAKSFYGPGSLSKKSTISEPIATKTIGIDYIIENKEFSVDHPGGETATPIIDYKASSKESYEGTKIKVLNVTNNIVEAEITYPDGEKFTETFDRKDFENKVFKIAVTATVADTAKKADIEKRRQEELNWEKKINDTQNKEDLLKIIKDISGRESSDMSMGFNAAIPVKNQLSDAKRIAIQDLKDIEKFFIKAINAKYDAELNALEGKTTQTTTSEYKIVKLKQPDFEGRQFAINDNGITRLFYTEQAAQNFIKNKTQASLPTPGSVNELSNLEAGIKGVVDDERPSENYRKYFEKSKKEKENIDEFKKWLSRVLPQISVEISNKLIDGKAFGSFVNGVIKLYESAEKGTGYHEAFEAVWNSYLTPDQKKALVEEYKSRKNYQQLPGYIWANENYPETSENYKIKEALAEEFIDYVRDEGKTTVVENSPVRNTIFRKLLNFIKKLWNHIQEAFGITNVRTNPTTINNLFKQIVDGQFANKLAVDTTTEPQYRATIKGTSVQFTHDLMEGMTSYFFNMLYNPELSDDTTIKALFDKNKPQLFQNIYEKVIARVKNDFVLEYKRIKENYISETGASDIDAKNFIASIPEFQYRNLVLSLFNTDVKENFKTYLSQFGLKFKDVKVKEDEEVLNQAVSKEEMSTDRLGIVDAIYVDPRNMTKNEVKLLIASLASYEYDNNNLRFERNDLGLPKLKDFGKKINLLINELTQIVPLKTYNRETKAIVDYPVIKQMFDKLANKYMVDGKYRPGYEWIDRLKFRLGYVYSDGNERSIDSFNEDELSLLIAFETSFTTNRNLPYKLIVGSDGAIYADNTLDSINAKRIREKWENNVKGFAKSFSYIDEKELYNAPMIYINKDGIISINNKSKEFIDLKGSTDSEIERLKKFGIQFSVDEDLLDSVKIGEAYRTIYEFISNGTIKTFDDLFGRQAVNSSINYLTKLEADLTGDETILSVRNAEGKQQYSSTLPSAISNIVNSFNSSKTLADFIASNPQLGNVDLNTGEVILFPYVQNSFILQKGGRYFDNKGNRRKNSNIEYRYILGMSGERESIGKSTDVLTFPDKIAQEIYHLLDGTYYTVINSDKSSEFGLHLNHFISFISATNDIIENDDILSAYKNALADEINTAIYETTSDAQKVKIKEYSSDVVNLGHFKNILNLNERKSLNAQYQNVLAGEMSVDEFINLSEVNAIIVNYLNTKIEKTKKWLVDSGVIKKVNENEFKTNFISKEKLQQLDIKINIEGFSNNDFTNLVKFLVVNRQLNVFEQHKLIYGHPDLYKELAKRSSGANSQTQVISENPAYLTWMDQNMKRFDGKSERTNTFRYTSYKDPDMASIYYEQIAEEIYAGMILPFKGKELPESFKKEFERIIGAEFDANGKMKSINAKKGTLMNAYINMTENDGGSYIMPDFFRDLHFLSGKENKEQNELLEYENALEILDRSNIEHPMYNVPGFAKTYSQTEINKAREIKAKGKPAGVMLHVLKPYGFGYNKTNVRRTHTSLLKNSVVPLTWSRVVGKQNMLEKYLQSQKDHVDIIAFEGSQKVGFVLEDNGVKAQELYNSDGHINTNPNPIQEMYTKYFGFQVEMADYAKDKVIFGSQMRKINLSNLPEELQSAASEYNKLIDALTENEFKSLLKELGLKKEREDYVTDDLSSMMDLLRSEVERRDLPENILDMLEIEIDQLGRQTLKYRFDASPIREKLNNILNALVDNRILAQEMNGKAAIQIPATMFETSDRKFTYLKDGIWQDPISGKEIQQLPKEQKDTAKIVSSDLEFYKKTTKDGKEVISSMEVYAPWFLKDVNPEDVGFELKNGIWMPKDPKSMESFLKSIGFRIPTQGMNSIDSIIIKGFLPEDWGDSVVVPSEIVAKAGSDFDIDKMNMFFKNLTVKDGQIVEIKYDADPQNVEQRYYRYINSEYGEILNPLKKILSNVKSKTNENNKAIKKLKNDIDLAEELLLKGDKNAGKLIANLFKLDIKDFNDLMNADIELQSLMYEGEYLYSVLNNAINKYEDALELAKSKFTLEEFSKLPIEQQNSKKAVQNKLIDLMSEILTHPSNFRQLVSPNSTSTVKPLAQEIRKIKGLKDSETDKTALSEWDEMTKIREAYVTGKKLVGIIALQITSHSISQYGNVELTGYYKNEDGIEEKIIINLDHTTQEGKLILNLVRDKNYQLISELLSESMNGAVDAAKDPFIFDLNLTLDTASTWFYLQKLGVPVKDLAYLHNQPAIVDFLNTTSKNKSIINTVNGYKSSKKDNLYVALTPYIFKSFSGYKIYDTYNDSYISLDLYDQDEIIELLSLNENELYDKDSESRVKLKNYKKLLKNIINSVETKPFTQSELKQMIKPLNELSVEQAKDQIALLKDYIKYQKQGQMLSDYIRGISVDTTRSKNLLENKLQENRYRKIINDGFIELSSLKNLMQKLFLGKIKSIKDDVSKMFQDYFVSLHPKSQPFMQKVYDIIDDTDEFMTDDEKILLLNRYENFFLTYLTHVVKIKNEGKEASLNTDYARLFMGENSLALKLKKYQNIYPDNIALQTLFGVINSDVNSTNNIKIFNTKMSTYEVNTFGEALVELYQFADRMSDVDLKNFVKDLSVFSILQSGVQISPISFTKILPLDFYSGVVGKIFDYFISNDDIMFTPDVIWKQFHQNNYSDGRLIQTVYYSKTTFDQTNATLRSITDRFNNTYRDDYVVIKFIKKDLLNNKAEQERLRKEKKWDEIYDTVLFERVKAYDSTGKEIGKELSDDYIKYVPIGTLGNKMYLTEAYAMSDAKSILKKNNSIDESQYTDLIEQHKRDMFNAYMNKQNLKEIESATTPTATTELFDPSLPKINIYAGTGENAELSNFAVRPFVATLGVKSLGNFQTVEGAYQAAKLLYTDEGLSDLNQSILDQLQVVNGKTAKSIGRDIQNLNTEDWNENSSDIMKELLKQSFEQNPKALQILLATGNATLTHTQVKGKWGKEFPKLLMEVRQELRNSQSQTIKMSAEVTNLWNSYKDRILAKNPNATEADLQKHANINGIDWLTDYLKKCY